MASRQSVTRRAKTGGQTSKEFSHDRLAAPNLTGRNRLECLALYALVQGVPLYSGVVLMMKLVAA
ncbi:hypothetical protein RAD16_16510 [Bradyrhizobium sp. 18BD]